MAKKSLSACVGRITRLVIVVWAFTQYALLNALPVPAPLHHAERGSLLALFKPTEIRECQGGKQYPVIREAEDLQRRYVRELECLYSVGVVPWRVPLGIYFGTLISIGQANVVNPIAEAIWTGKVALKTYCTFKKPLYILWNFMMGVPRFFAALSLGNVTHLLAPGEYDDKRGGLIVDYTVNFSALCPRQGSFSLNRATWGFLQNTFPVNEVVDVLRIVGRDEEGALIYLGKTLFRNVYARGENHTYQTLGYWSVRIFDFTGDFVSIFPLNEHASKNGEYQNTSSFLPPVAETFKYRMNYFPDVLRMIVSPFLVKTPTVLQDFLTTQIGRMIPSPCSTSAIAVVTGRYANTRTWWPAL